MKDLSMILQEALARVMNPIIYKVEGGVITETRSYSYGLKEDGLSGKDIEQVFIPAFRPGKISETYYIGINAFHTLEEAKAAIINNSREWMQFHMNKFIIEKNELEKAMNGDFVIKQTKSY